MTTSLRFRIRIARAEAKLSRSVLARRVGVSASAAAQWEHPHGTSPSLENLLLIAEATTVSFDWLVSGRGAARATSVDAPAVHPDAFARDLDEERLLALWRLVPERHRETLFVVMSRLGE